ncbi:MAG: AraC family transcriptional regulator [Bacteroidales bacterium]|nr:AraC family transcriptional regulator [Bacteroidales bacterium]MCF8327099.1 AraC family transcriptional regulator [Bacteroidales bacterium]
MSTLIHIKNMVCPRCIMAVRDLFSGMNYTVEDTQLGWVRVTEDIPQDKFPEIRQKLEDIGFELMEDYQAQLVEKVKTIIVNRIHHAGLENYENKLSSEIAEKTRKDYHYLSRLFSSKEGITIEKYIILQKIEKAKELLVYNQETLSEIAYKLGYSSVSHISKQFREVTGMTPSGFKNQSGPDRKTIDQIT